MNNKNNEQNEIIVNNIRTFAASRRTNIATIERELGIGNGTIGKWTKAAKSPPYETLYKIATYFGVTVAELTGEADEKGIKNSPGTDHSAEADELRAKIIASLDGLSLDTLESLSAQIDVIRSRNRPR